MLVLSRKVGEKLVIDGNITVVVTRVAGNRVTLGIEAPNHVRVVRGELEPQESRPQETLRTTRAQVDGSFQHAEDVAGVSVPRLAK
jgi:carbon storage regulator